MPGFQVFQLVHQEVEVLIADDGLVQYIVSVVVLMQLSAQLANPLFVGCHKGLSYLVAAKLRKKTDDCNKSAEKNKSGGLPPDLRRKFSVKRDLCQ
jgi:hypothetical protein